MPNRRTIFVLLAAVSVAFALLTGCSSFSSSKDTGKPLPDAATLLKESGQTTKNLKSVHLTLSVAGKIAKLPVKTLSGDLANSPSTAAKGQATITFGGSDVDIDFVVVDATLYAALSPNDWTDFGPAADIYDPSAILNPDTGLANMLANFTDPKAEAHETIDGQDTIRVTGKVTADAVNKLAAQLKATQPLPATVWIQENGDHQLVRAQLEQSPGNSIQMTLSNWDQPVSVTKPAGV